MEGTISPEFSVVGQAGFIAFNGFIYAYHAGTGEGVEHIQEPLQPPDHWYSLEDVSRGRYHLRYDEFGRHDAPSEGIPISQTTLREGWVDGPEGKHLLWLPIEWRMRGGYAMWFRDTLQLELPGGLVVVNTHWNPPLLQPVDGVNESRGRPLMRSIAAS